MDLVGFENQGSSRTNCPEASRVDQQCLAVEAAILTSRARSALFSKFRKRQARALDLPRLGQIVTD